jgi:hypothetical protein
MKPGRIVALVFGCIAALIGIGMFFGAIALGAVYGTQRDSAGFFSTGTVPMQTTTAALRSEKVDLGSDEDPDRWPFRDGDLATVRLRAQSPSDTPIFIGIAHTSDVDAYIGGAAHDEVTDIHWSNDRVRYRRVDGERADLPPPTEQDIWVAEASGSGRQALTWDVEGGNWSIVVMNADGTRGVFADVGIGIKIKVLPWIILGIGIGALIMLGIATGLIIWATRQAGRKTQAIEGAMPPPALVPATVPAARTPVSLNARLDEPLSRGLWLVKWFLAIPHYFVLAFLWLAFVVTTFIAWWAILFTGRYPRGLFDFNVGVLRWTWRVAYYATSGIGTDKYPPFSLQPADYPATLEIAYPERLSRGLIFVKWLLIIPHWIIVAFFIGGGWYVRERTNGWGAGGGFGLIGWMTIIAGVALLFTGRYPKGLYNFVMGMNRWVARAFVYPALMTDQYPPFTLDQGPTEQVEEAVLTPLEGPTSWPPPPPSV